MSYESNVSKINNPRTNAYNIKIHVESQRESYTSVDHAVLILVISLSVQIYSHSASLHTGVIK